MRLNSLTVFLRHMCEYKRIKCDLQKEFGGNECTQKERMSSVYILKDLLEGELFDSGVGHQVEEDLEGLSRLQGLLWQPEEHVLV